MTPITRTLRTGAVTATAAALLVLTGTAALAGDGATAEVDVTHDCTSIDVTSTKAISNVVLAFADGDTQRFEGLGESRTGTFAGTGDDSGEVITTAWIKSGNNKSGDGPGYGERFDFDTSACEDAAPAGSDAQQSNDVDATTTSKDEAPTDDPTDDPTNDATTADADDQDPKQASDDGPAESATNEAGADDDATGATDEDTVSTDAETPATSVLGAVEQREAGTGLRSADASDVRSAETLPNTGGEPALPLAAGLAALALGGGLLRRTSRSSA